MPLLTTRFNAHLYLFIYLFYLIVRIVSKTQVKQHIKIKALLRRHWLPQGYTTYTAHLMLRTYVMLKFRSRKANFIVYNVYNTVIITVIRKLYENLDKQRKRMVRPDT